MDRPIPIDSGKENKANGIREREEKKGNGPGSWALCLHDYGTVSPRAGWLTSTYLLHTLPPTLVLQITSFCAAGSFFGPGEIPPSHPIRTCMHLEH